MSGVAIPRLRPCVNGVISFSSVKLKKINRLR